jgi:hypothetical protein
MGFSTQRASNRRGANMVRQAMRALWSESCWRAWSACEACARANASVCLAHAGMRSGARFRRFWAASPPPAARGYDDPVRGRLKKKAVSSGPRSPITASQEGREVELVMAACQQRFLSGE